LFLDNQLGFLRLGWIVASALTSSIRFSLVVVKVPNCDYTPSAQKKLGNSTITFKGYLMV
jgi:hypothetical protein